MCLGCRNSLHKLRNAPEWLEMQDQEKTIDLSLKTILPFFSQFDISGSQVRPSLLVLILMVFLQNILSMIDKTLGAYINILVIVKPM